MTDLELIRSLDISSVTPEHFIELGNDVVQALRDTLGDDLLREIYDIAKGSDAEGFGDRLADALEKYVEVHPELFSVEDTEPKQNDANISTEEIQVNLDELREHYQEMRDTHLSRNIFVSWEKLRVDLAARRNDEVGADGKYKVSGGTIAVDILGIIRGNIFETIIEEVVRRILDSIFPAEKDPVATSDMHENQTFGFSEVEFPQEEVYIDHFGVHDSGYVENTLALDRETLNSVREANPLYGQHFGFDMTKSSVQNGSMRIWRGGFHKNIDAAINGVVRSVGIPNISMVELGQNLYHVSPFGQILNSEIKNDKTELPVGSVIERLDISTGQRREVFESQAISEGCTVDELKIRYTGEVQEAFISRIEDSLERHSTYIKDTAIPEIESVKESYRGDLFVLDTRESAIKAELDRLGDQSIPDDSEKRQALENKLERISEYKQELENGISRMEDREERLQETLERYVDCKDAISQQGMDTESRYMLVSNLEKESVGRTEISEYIPKERDIEIRQFCAVEKEEILKDIERYNEDHPDNSLKEKDGSIYNRYGISETGAFNPDMCEKKDMPAFENKEDKEAFIGAHASDGFSEFQDYIDQRDAGNDSVDKDNDKVADREDLNSDSARSDPVDIVTSSESSVDIAENSNADNADGVETTSQGLDTAGSADLEKKQDLKGFDADVAYVAQDEELSEATDLLSADDTEEDSQNDGRPEIIERSDNKSETDGEETEIELYDEIINGFKEYLDNDTYSFSGDLAPVIQDADIQVVDQIMGNALRDLYLESDMSKNERLFSLTTETAIFSDNGIMPTIENLVNGLSDSGMSDNDIAQTLIDMEPYIIRGMEDLVSISADDTEQRTIRIGDEIWTVSADSVINDVTGLEEDPNNLVDNIVSAVNGIYGDGVGDTAVEETSRLLDTMTDAQNFDFLDMFFNNGLECTLQQIMIDMIPESVREDYVNDTSVDLTEDLNDPSKAVVLEQQEFEDQDDFSFLPDIEYEPSILDF